MFEDRWGGISKRKYQWATKDNDEHNNGANIFLLDGHYLVKAWLSSNGFSLSMRTEQEKEPTTLEAAKEMAEKFIETLNKVEVQDV